MESARQASVTASSTARQSRGEWTVHVTPAHDVGSRFVIAKNSRWALDPREITGRAVTREHDSARRRRNSQLNFVN
jgi:hypothetical protein